MPKTSERMNEYTIVRLNRPEAGTLELRPEDPRRLRYYIRAKTDGAAVEIMAQRFPGEQFYVLDVVKDVAPYSWDVAEVVKRAINKGAAVQPLSLVTCS